MLILIPIALLTWYLVKDSKEELKPIIEELKTVPCPTGLCDVLVGEKLTGECQGCGICWDKKDYLKESHKNVLEIADTEEITPFRVSAPILISDQGDFEIQEYELEPKTLDSLTAFGVIIHNAKLFDCYDGLKLDEGGYSKLGIDYWKLLGLSQNDAEDLVYQGKYPSNNDPLLQDFWTKI